MIFNAPRRKLSADHHPHRLSRWFSLDFGIARTLRMSRAGYHTTRFYKWLCHLGGISPACPPAFTPLGAPVR